MPKSRPPYPPVFRRRLVELVRGGRSPEELAREFEPGAQASRNWVRQADRDDGRRADGLTSPEREEIRRLRREVKQLRLTREILAKATAWIAQRNFAAQRPNQLWVADITYIPTWAGCLYLPVVLDAFSRRIIGWAMATHLRTEVVLDALEMALSQRRPQEVIHPSDPGCQYTSIAFGQRCKAAGVRPSMGSVGDCCDNAMAESFFATLECELLDRTRFRPQADARIAVFESTEAWYNPHRRHSAVDYPSPIQYEQIHQMNVEQRKP